MERTVLIIEDEKLIIVSTQMVLEAAGFRVESATNGEDGIAKAKSLSPDLVLLDIMMPGIDGWETLTRLKRDASTSRIPVIVFTAREHSRGHQRSSDLGAARAAWRKHGAVLVLLLCALALLLATLLRWG